MASPNKPPSRRERERDRDRDTDGRDLEREREYEVYRERERAALAQVERDIQESMERERDWHIAREKMLAEQRMREYELMQLQMHEKGRDRHPAAGSYSAPPSSVGRSGGPVGPNPPQVRRHESAGSAHSLERGLAPSADYGPRIAGSAQARIDSHSASHSPTASPPVSRQSGPPNFGAPEAALPAAEASSSRRSRGGHSRRRNGGGSASSAVALMQPPAMPDMYAPNPADGSHFDPHTGHPIAVGSALPPPPNNVEAMSGQFPPQAHQLPPPTGPLPHGAVVEMAALRPGESHLHPHNTGHPAHPQMIVDPHTGAVQAELHYASAPPGQGSILPAQSGRRSRQHEKGAFAAASQVDAYALAPVTQSTQRVSGSKSSKSKNGDRSSASHKRNASNGLVVGPGPVVTGHRFNEVPSTGHGAPLAVLPGQEQGPTLTSSAADPTVLQAQLHAQAQLEAQTHVEAQAHAQAQAQAQVQAQAQAQAQAAAAAAAAAAVAAASFQRDLERDRNWSGPRVESEIVWEYLDRCERKEALLRRKATLDYDSSLQTDVERDTQSKEARNEGQSSMHAMDLDVELGQKDEKANLRERLAAAVIAYDTETDSPEALALSLSLDPPNGYGMGEDRGRPVKHLGTWLYDSRIDPLLPGELLSANVGATLEVRIPGAQLGRGPSTELFAALGFDNVLPGIELGPVSPTAKLSSSVAKEGRKATTPSGNSASGASATIGPNENKGRWTLGWRGREHEKLRAQIALEEGNTKEEHNRHKRRKPLSAVVLQEAAPEIKNEASEEQVHQGRKRAEEAIEAAWAFWSAASLRERKCWGTDVYTDDSDVLAMCIHAGWIEPPSLDLDQERIAESAAYEEGHSRFRRGPGLPGWVPSGKAMWAWKAMSATDPTDTGAEPSGDAVMTDSTSRPESDAIKPLSRIASSTQQVSLRQAEPRPPDLSVMLRIAPRLIAYRGCLRAGFKSRCWGNTHDGVSLVVESVELKEPGYATAKGRRATKVRLKEMATLRRAVLGTSAGKTTPSAYSSSELGLDAEETSAHDPQTTDDDLPARLLTRDGISTGLFTLAEVADCLVKEASQARGDDPSDAGPQKLDLLAGRKRKFWEFAPTFHRSPS